MKKTFKRIATGFFAATFMVTSVPVGSIPVKAGTEQENGQAMDQEEKAEPDANGEEHTGAAGADKADDDAVGTGEEGAGQSESGEGFAASDTGKEAAVQDESDEEIDAAVKDQEAAVQDESDEETDAAVKDQEAAVQDESGEETDAAVKDQEAAVQDESDKEAGAADADQGEAGQVEPDEAPVGSSAGEEKAGQSLPANPLLFTSEDFKTHSNGSVTLKWKDQDIEEGTYAIQISATGNSRGYQVLIDGRAAALVTREPGEAEEETTECVTEEPILLTGKETITIKPSDGYREEDEKLTGEITAVELLILDEETLIADGADVITLYGADWFPGEADGEPDLQKKQWIDFMILEQNGFEADDYLVTAQITGERSEYRIKVNGKNAGVLADVAGDEGDGEARLFLAEEPLALEPGDILTVYAADDGSGFVEELNFTSRSTFLDEVPLMLLAEEAGIYRYEAENYCSRTHDNQGDGDVKWCDMQPGETITFKLKDQNLEAGNYRLSIQSNGNRIAYLVYVDGKPAGVLRREGSGWGTAGLEDDSLETVLSLKGEEEITIKAPDNKNNGGGYSYYGQVDAITLTATEEEPENPEPAEEIILHSGDWYFGDPDDSGGVNLRPGDHIDYFILAENGFAEEEASYEMTVETGGFNREYKVKVNGKQVGSFSHDGSGDWDPCGTGRATLSGFLVLQEGDILTISSDDSWGVVGDVTLVKQEEEPFSETDEETGITVNADGSVIPAGSLLTVEEADPQAVEAICQASGAVQEKGVFYNISVQAPEGGEIQPVNGKASIEIPLPEGCRADTCKIYFLAEDGTVSELQAAVANGMAVLETGWFGTFAVIDTYVQVEGSYLYEAEDYCRQSHGNQGEGDVRWCDMQPGETITFELKDQSLPEGNYHLSIRSNGNRIAYLVYVDGKPAGILRRKDSGWGVAALRDDSLETVLSLTGQEQITIKAPDNKNGGDGDSYFGQVDSITLTPTNEEVTVPEPMEEIILHSEDWYFGDPDGSGGVNLRPGDYIDYFLLTEHGFSEEEASYEMTVKTGGFGRTYTVKVNGTSVGTFQHVQTTDGWEPCGTGTETLTELLKLKAGDVLTISADDSWGVVGDVTLTKMEVQDPFQAEDPDTGITVNAEPGVVLEGSSLSVAAADQAKVEDVCGRYGIDSSSGIFYQIVLKDESGSTIPPRGQVNITIPLPEGCQEEQITIYRITESGNLETVAAAISDGRIRIETKELGIFAILYNAGTITTLEAEDFYKGSSEIQSDGGVKFCDLQPGESVDFQIPADMEEGCYHLTASSNGTRTAYAVSVNGILQGVIKRSPTEWGAADLTRDPCNGVLWLKPGDRVTLTASTNLYDGGDQDYPGYGKLDSITLTSTAKPEIPQDQEEITLVASDWYGGTQDSSGGMNIRPGDGIDFAVREQDGFVEGDYLIQIEACGFRNSYLVKVNGSTVMSLSLRRSDWGTYLTATARQKLHLKPGDVVTFYTEESYGCIDTVTFIKDGVPMGSTMADRTGGRIRSVDYDTSMGPKASGTEPVFIYQGEGYYQKQKDNPAADLQPGEQIEISLADNENFVDGLYRVTVVSCGGRDHMFVKVNGQKTGRIDRRPNGYGMENMTNDRLERTVTLHKGDLLCIEAAPSEWGWVDYIRLDLVQKSEEQTQGGKRYEYKAMNYYGKKQADSDTADLQPGERIEIPINEAAFEEGYYLISATSCGGRQKMLVEINGQEAGWIQRNSNNYGVRSLVRDTMPVPVYLKAGDRVAICAPTDGGWAWVDRVDFIKTAR